MITRVAKVDREFTTEICSDRNKSNEENFLNFLSPFKERFIVLDETSSKPMGKSGFRFSLKWTCNGLARLLITEASPFSLAFYFKRNPYHGYFGLIMPVSEELTFEIEKGRTKKIRPNESFIFDPTKPVKIVSQYKNKLLFLLLATNYLHQRCDCYFTNFSEMSLGAINNQFNLLPSFLKMLVENEKNINETNLVDLVEAFCIFLRRTLNSGEKQKRFSALSKHDYLRSCAVDFMNMNLSQSDLSLSKIADSVGVSSRQLSSLFKEVGTTPMNVLQEIRLEKASTELRLLEYDHLSIKDILQRNGFTSLSHFGKLFKARFKKTPSDWRNNV